MTAPRRKPKREEPAGSRAAFVYGLTVVEQFERERLAGERLAQRAPKRTKSTKRRRAS